MLKALMAGTVIAGAIVMFTATAAPPPKADQTDQSLVMSRLDFDHDGSVSPSEAKAAAGNEFAALDTDGDGTLDTIKLIGIMGPEEFARADRDHDGTIVKAEFIATVDALFKEADTNHDGILEPKELSASDGRALVALLAYSSS